MQVSHGHALADDAALMHEEKRSLNAAAYPSIWILLLVRDLPSESSGTLA
jgi:hypothetical protein